MQEKGASLTVVWESLFRSAFGLMGEGRESNGSESNKMNWINKDDKRQTTEVNGTWEILPSLYKNLIDLGILIEHVRRPANKFLLWLIYINISRM